MRRPLAVIAAALLFCGCQGTSPGGAPVDPFFGRTRIEPPRTGSVAAPRAYDPYYSGTRQASIPQKPALQQSGGVPRPQTSGAWQPPGAGQSSNSGALRLQNVSQPPPAQSSLAGSGQRQGDLVVVPLNARQGGTTSGLAATQTAPAARTASTRNSAAPAGATATATDAQSTPSTLDAARRLASSVYEQGRAAAVAGRERIIGVIEPRAKEMTSSAGTGSQATGVGTGAAQPWKPATSGTRAVNITDLPPPNRSSAVQRATGSVHDGGVRLASAIEELPSETPARDPRYGCDPEYRWLKGRLEYSQVDRRWKLRYIPIDGTTDDFGGSVVLTDTPLLSGYERGDFVELHGRLLKPESTGKSFSAGYEIREIRRLAHGAAG